MKGVQANLVDVMEDVGNLHVKMTQLKSAQSENPTVRATDGKLSNLVDVEMSM
jgi:hypothetical protein